MQHISECGVLAPRAYYIFDDLNSPLSYYGSPCCAMHPLNNAPAMPASVILCGTEFPISGAKEVILNIIHHIPYFSSVCSLPG